MSEDNTPPQPVKTTRKKKAPYGLETRTILTPGPAFTPSQLRKVLIKIKGDLALPDDAEIAKLAAILTTWKRYFYAAQEARAINLCIGQAKDSLKTLCEVMPKIHQHHSRYANAGDGFFSGQMAKSAEKLLRAITDPDASRFIHFESLPDQAKDWRWLIEVLPVDFVNAMRPANPTAEIGASKTGPLARFLAAVLPSVTGETRTESAIGTQLIKAKVSKGDIATNNVS